MGFDETKTVTTPEQVSVTYTLAGIGTRFGAMVADTIIQFLAVVLLFFAIGALVTTVSLGDLSALEEMAPSWLLALSIVAFFALIWGYFILWETIWHGQTPGKRLAGIRVMRDGGYPVDFRAAFVRNICRYVDFLPMFYGVGALAMFLSKDSKRLGDYAAGTIVVMDSRPAPIAAGAGSGVVLHHRLLGDPSMLNLRAITRAQFAVVERFLARCGELPETTRAELARKIAAPLMPLIGIDPPAGEGYPYESFLVELASAYRARMGG